MEDDLAKKIRTAYVTERQRLLEWQEQQTEQARARIKARDGFSSLSADQSHKVLRWLDKILSEGEKPLIVKVDLSLRNREVSSEAEVETLVGEIRDRLLEQVRTGTRVRLV